MNVAYLICSHVFDENTWLSFGWMWLYVIKCYQSCIKNMHMWVLVFWIFQNYGRVWIHSLQHGNHLMVKIWSSFDSFRIFDVYTKLSNSYKKEHEKTRKVQVDIWLINLTSDNPELSFSKKVSEDICSTLL